MDATTKAEPDTAHEGVGHPVPRPRLAAAAAITMGAQGGLLLLIVAYLLFQIVLAYPDSVLMLSQAPLIAIPLVLATAFGVGHIQAGRGVWIRDPGGRRLGLIVATILALYGGVLGGGPDYLFDLTLLTTSGFIVVALLRTRSWFPPGISATAPQPIPWRSTSGEGPGDAPIGPSRPTAVRIAMALLILHGVATVSIGLVGYAAKRILDRLGNQETDPWLLVLVCVPGLVAIAIAAGLARRWRIAHAVGLVAAAYLLVNQALLLQRAPGAVPLEVSVVFTAVAVAVGASLLVSWRYFWRGQAASAG